jgi:hypothetical protein
MSAHARKAKAIKAAWQEDVARLYFRVLCELRLERRWIPTEELALAGVDFQSLFKAGRDGDTFRCPMAADGSTNTHIVFRSATYNCADQQGVNVFARRFTRCPRNWTFVYECPSAAPVPAATPAAPRFLLELVGPQRLLAISD